MELTEREKEVLINLFDLVANIDSPFVTVNGLQKMRDADVDWDVLKSIKRKVVK